MEKTYPKTLEHITTWKTTGSGFAQVIESALSEELTTAKEMAGHFEAGPRAPERWATNVARPHPRIQKLVVDWLCVKLEIVPA